MRTAERALRHFMKEGKSDAMIKEIEIPDVPLWAIWAIQHYARTMGVEACREKYGRLVTDILDYIIRGNHPNLLVHDNGLLYSSGRNAIISWMNSTLNGAPVNPRSGYLVEMNGLWYNALRFAADLMAQGEGSAAHIEKWNTIAEKVKGRSEDTRLNSSHVT